MKKGAEGRGRSRSGKFGKRQVGRAVDVPLKTKLKLAKVFSDTERREPVSTHGSYLCTLCTWCIYVYLLPVGTVAFFRP